MCDISKIARQLARNARLLNWILLSILVICLAASRSNSFSLAENAVSYNWSHYDAGLPFQAMTLTLATDPQQPGALYAATYIPAGVWFSADGGASWQRDAAGLPTTPVYDLLWDTHADGLWAATEEGVYFRARHETTWSDMGFAESTYALAQTAAGTIYALSSSIGPVRRAANGEWHFLSLDPAVAPNGFLALAVSPSEDTLYVGTAGAGLWISHDRGASWNSAAELAEAYISALLVTPTVCYARTLKRVYQSTDGGYTWTPIPTLDERAYGFATDERGVHYVALKGAVACNDNHEWQIHHAGLPQEQEILDIHIAPWGDERIYASTRTGVYVSTNRGQQWTRCPASPGYPHVTALAEDGQGRLLGSTLLGLYRVNDTTEHWSPVTAFPVHGLIHDIAPFGTSRDIYVSVSKGLWHSADSGATWQEIPAELAAHDLLTLVVDPTDSQHLWCRLAYERVYESTDGGHSWMARWEGLGTERIILSLAIAPDDSGLLLAGANAGLFRWDYGAGYWTPLATQLEEQSVFAILIVPPTPRIYVGATTGLWHSADGGATWQQTPALAHRTVSAIAQHGTTLFVGTLYHGLYASTDDGATWERVPQVPATATVHTILASPRRDAVYVSTDRGVFRGLEE